MRTDLALAALASAAVPGMKPVAVAGIGPSDEGREGELQSALVEDATGRRWVVRAPLTPVAGARLQRNDELVRQLSRHVPFKVPAAVGYAPLGKDGSAAVYPYVEGAPLELRRLPGGPGLASAVGRAIAAIHNIPRALFEEQDVPVFDAGGARQRAVAEVDRAAETGRVPTGLLARWEEAFEAVPLWQFATTPVHGAFSGSSVVVAFTDEEEAATGRVVAVTDWDEAMVGDPAVDLAELWSQSSRQAWESVLESYTLARTHRPDPYLHARARLVAEMRSLRGLARAVAEDDEEGARRAVEVLRRVDRLTEADDSLVPVTARSSGSRPTRPTGAVLPDEPGQAGAPSGERSGEDRPDDTGADDPSSAGTDDDHDHDHDHDQHVAPVASADDVDLTMEVPAPVGASPEETDEDATVRIDLAGHEEPDADDGLRTPDAGARPGVGPEATGTVDGAAAEVSSADPLGHDPVPAGGDLTRRGDVDARDDEDLEVRPVQEEAERPEGRDGPGPDELAKVDEDAPADEPEDLEDDERLHELYGMPSAEHDSDGR